MALKILYLILIIIVACRGFSYGVYCFKNSSKCGGICVFLLTALSAAVWFI